MPIRTLIIVSALAGSVVSAAEAAPGRLDTLPLGRYLCEVPGDAASRASIPVKGAWFDIVNASSYDAEGGGGTYLLTDKTLVFTRGPMKGATFERATGRTLRRVDDDGKVGKMRCVRTGRAD